MAPTMEDIAQRLGVAKSTVSLALNAKPGVSDELRERIVRVAGEMGYQLPRRGANKGVEHASFLVVYHVVPEMDAEPSGVALGYVTGIQQYARDANLHLTILTDQNQGPGQRFGFQLLDRSALLPDGVILMGPALTRTSPFFCWAESNHVPFVVLSRNWFDMPVSTVSQDHHEQASLAMEHLLALGHRKIAFLATDVDLACDWYPWRLECYRDSLTRVGLPVDPSLIVVGKDGREAASRLLEAHPDATAIMGIYDSVAIEIMQGLREHGKRVPHDISVIGLDNAVQAPEDLPALTTVGFSHPAMGYLGAELIAKQLEEPEFSYAHVVVRSKLIERGSCAPPPSRGSESP